MNFKTLKNKISFFVLFESRTPFKIIKNFCDLLVTVQYLDCSALKIQNDFVENINALIYHKFQDLENSKRDKIHNSFVHSIKSLYY